MPITSPTSLQLSQQFSHHVGLNRLFSMHDLINERNPQAFADNELSAGMVQDRFGDVSCATDIVTMFLSGDEPSAVVNLNKDPAAVSAFIAAVYDIERAAHNVDARIKPNAKQIIAAHINQGLKVDQ